MKLVVRMAAVVVVCAGATDADAGSPYRGNGAVPTPPSVGNPAASGVPNVPDLQGCVKWCPRDMSPCDPPLYKRTDARCNNFD